MYTIMRHIRSSVGSSLPSLLLPLPSSGIIQHGDLEFFLSELRLGQYIHPLREQGTTFANLLSVTDEGLIRCVRGGVTWRKRKCQVEDSWSVSLEGNSV